MHSDWAFCRLLDRLLASGGVSVNQKQMHIQAPFGGKKASGIGREFGEYVCELWTHLQMRHADCITGLESFHRAKNDPHQVSSPRLCQDFFSRH